MIGQKQASQGQERRVGRPRYQDLDVLGEIEEQMRHPSLSGAALHAHLQQRFPTKAPQDIRTTRSLMADYRPRDPSGPWALVEVDPADAAVVLAARATALDRIGPPGWQITRRHGGWIARVARIAPDIPPWWAWWEGHKYRVREEQKQPTDDLDLVLAAGPWRSEESFRSFATLARRAFRWDETIPGGILDACRMEAERTRETLSTVYQRHFGVRGEEENDGEAAG